MRWFSSALAVWVVIQVESDYTAAFLPNVLRNAVLPNNHYHAADQSRIASHEIPSSPRTILSSTLDKPSINSGVNRSLKDEQQMKELALIQAYNKWRRQHNKATFDPIRFHNFKFNYQMVAEANEASATQARLEGKPVPQAKSLNHNGDKSPEELGLEKSIRAQQQEAINGASTPTNGDKPPTDSKQPWKPNRSVPEPPASVAHTVFQQIPEKTGTVPAKNTGKVPPDVVIPEGHANGSKVGSSVPSQYGDRRGGTTYLDGISTYSPPSPSANDSPGTAKGGGTSYLESMNQQTPTGPSDASEKKDDKLQGSTSESTKEGPRDNPLWKRYESWCEYYKKVPDESRFSTFAANCEMIEAAFTKTGRDVVLNEFTDLTPDEFKARRKAGTLHKNKNAKSVKPGVTNVSFVAKPKVYVPASERSGTPVQKGTVEEQEIRSVYNNWCKTYRKTPSDNRLRVFMENSSKAEAYFKKTGEIVPMNMYADLTPEEHKLETKQSPPWQSVSTKANTQNDEIPHFIDPKSPTVVAKSPAQSSMPHFFQMPPTDTSSGNSPNLEGAKTYLKEQPTGNQSADTQQGPTPDLRAATAAQEEAEKLLKEERRRILRAEKEAKAKVEEERKRVAAEAEATALKKAEAEEKRLAKAIEEKRKIEEAMEAKRLALQAETKQKAKEDQKRIEILAAKAKKADEERARIALEAESKRRKEDERARIETEAKKAAEEKRMRLAYESETKRQAEEEQRRLAADAKKMEEEKQDRLAAEAASKLKMEEERQQAEEKMRLENERQRLLREDAMKKEEERQRNQMEAATEAMTKAEEDQKREALEAEAKRRGPTVSGISSSSMTGIGSTSYLETMNGQESNSVSPTQNSNKQQASGSYLETINRDNWSTSTGTSVSGPDENPGSYMNNLNQPSESISDARTQGQQYARQNAIDEGNRVADEMMAKRQAEQEKRLAEEASRRQEVEARRKEAETQRRAAEEARRVADEKISLAAEAKAKREVAEAAARRIAEEQRLLEEELKRKADAEALLKASQSRLQQFSVEESNMKKDTEAVTSSPTTKIPITSQSSGNVRPAGNYMGAVAKTWVEKSAYLEKLKDDPEGSKIEGLSSSPSSTPSVSKKQDRQTVVQSRSLDSERGTLVVDEKEAFQPRQKGGKEDTNWVAALFDLFGPKELDDVQDSMVVEKTSPRATLSLTVAEEDLQPREFGRGSIRIPTKEEPSIFSFFSFLRNNDAEAAYTPRTQPIEEGKPKKGFFTWFGASSQDNLLNEEEPQGTDPAVVKAYERNRRQRARKTAQLEEERERLLREKEARERVKSRKIERERREMEREELEMRRQAQARGSPTLGMWIQNEDGSISGNVSNSREFQSGMRITTSPVRMEVGPNRVVTTVSGSKYKLGLPAFNTGFTMPNQSVPSPRQQQTPGVGGGFGSTRPARPSFAIEEPNFNIFEGIQDAFSPKPKELLVVKDWKQSQDGIVSGRVAGIGLIRIEIPDYAEPGSIIRAQDGTEYFLDELPKQGLGSFFFGGGKQQDNNPYERLGRQEVAVMSKWRQNPDGSITGFVRNKSGFKNGSLITTSPVRLGAREGMVVKTEGGSLYELR